MSCSSEAKREKKKRRRKKKKKLLPQLALIFTTGNNNCIESLVLEAYSKMCFISICDSVFIAIREQRHCSNS